MFIKNFCFDFHLCLPIILRDYSCLLCAQELLLQCLRDHMSYWILSLGQPCTAIPTKVSLQPRFLIFNLYLHVLWGDSNGVFYFLIYYLYYYYLDLGHTMVLGLLPALCLKATPSSTQGTCDPGSDQEFLHAKHTISI